MEFETLVFDDDSSDDTEAVVTKEFPGVRYFRSPERLGYIVLRNQGFARAKGKYVFSIDDDAWFTDSTTLAQAVAVFNEFGNTVLALHYVEPGATSVTQLKHGDCVRSYVGCAHAIRRDIALELGGYRDFFVHQGEERDLCIRLWDRGHEIRFANTPPIVHCPSVNRDLTRWHSRGIRNTFLFDFLNSPLPHLPWRMTKSALQLLRHSSRESGLLNTAKWFSLGFWDCLRHCHRRLPVRASTFQRVSQLPFAGPSSSKISTLGD